MVSERCLLARTVPYELVVGCRRLERSFVGWQNVAVYWEPRCGQVRRRMSRLVVCLGALVVGAVVDLEVVVRNVKGSSGRGRTLYYGSR